MPSLDQSPERHDEIVFVVKLKQYGRHDERHILDAASVLGRMVNRGFGLDRAEVWHEGSRVSYDKKGQAQLVTAEDPPATNGKVN